MVPNIFRNSIINAAEIATFDQVKDMILARNLMQDNIYCHIVSSSVAGFVAAVVGSPVDVIKTRIMNSVQLGLGRNLESTAASWTASGVP